MKKHPFAFNQDHEVPRDPNGHSFARLAQKSIVEPDVLEDYDAGPLVGMLWDGGSGRHCGGWQVPARARACG